MTDSLHYLFYRYLITLQYRPSMSVTGRTDSASVEASSPSPSSMVQTRTAHSLFSAALILL